MEHVGTSFRFLHRAPGAVDCWDGVDRCRNCGRKYVTAGYREIKYGIYMAKVGHGNVRQGWPFTRDDEIEDCGTLIVRDVTDS